MILRHNFYFEQARFIQCRYCRVIRVPKVQIDRQLSALYNELASLSTLSCRCTHTLCLPRLQYLLSLLCMSNIVYCAYLQCSLPGQSSVPTQCALHIATQSSMYVYFLAYLLCLLINVMAIYKVAQSAMLIYIVCISSMFYKPNQSGMPM